MPSERGLTFPERPASIEPTLVPRLMRRTADLEHRGIVRERRGLARPTRPAGERPPRPPRAFRLRVRRAASARQGTSTSGEGLPDGGGLSLRIARHGVPARRALEGCGAAEEGRGLLALQPRYRSAHLLGLARALAQGREPRRLAPAKCARKSASPSTSDRENRGTGSGTSTSLTTAMTSPRRDRGGSRRFGPRWTRTRGRCASRKPSATTIEQGGRSAASALSFLTGGPKYASSSGPSRATAMAPARLSRALSFPGLSKEWGWPECLSAATVSPLAMRAGMSFTRSVVLPDPLGPLKTTTGGRRAGISFETREGGR